MFYCGSNVMPPHILRLYLKEATTKMDLKEVHTAAAWLGCLVCQVFIEAD